MQRSTLVMGTRFPVFLLSFLAAISILFLFFSPHIKSAILPITPSLDPLNSYHTPSGHSAASQHKNFAHSKDNLFYRQHLELTTSPQSQLVHSPTLTFTHIYVLSLPNRTDRREMMRKLANALGLEIVFVDAVDKESPFIRWIAERVLEVRQRKARLIGKARGMPAAKIGGLAIPSVWLSPTADRHGLVPFPSLNDDPRFPSGSWVDHLEAAATSSNLHTLIPSNPHLNVTQHLWDPLEKIGARQVNVGVISTFWGHTRVIKKALEMGDESALVLEDDVDIEWDIQKLWSRIEQKLPVDWEVCMVGHCWGKEYLRPAYLHPHLHQSSAPLCLHAYAMSKLGLARLDSLLNDPWTAYSTAIDTALPTFIASSRVNSFSIEPPLVIQRKNGPSDIQPGVGSVWRGLLTDSTVERIWRDEGVEFTPDVFDEDNLDPATRFRGRISCKK